MTTPSPSIPLQWRIQPELYAWFKSLAERLYMKPSDLIRSFLLRLKEGDPAVHNKVLKFIEFGLQQPRGNTMVARIRIASELHNFLTDFVSPIHMEPIYRRWEVRPGHLLTGYIIYLRKNESRCIRHGSIEIPL